MSNAVLDTTERNTGIHADFAHRIVLSGLIVLSVFHVPLVSYGDNSIGLFDLALLASVIVLLVHPVRLFIPHSWAVLVFSFVAYVSFLWLRLPFWFTPYSILVALKYVEHLVYLIVVTALLWTHRNDWTFIRRTIEVTFLLFALYGAALWVAGIASRLGLPFKPRISSNPAGFSLALGLIYFLDVGLKKENRNLFTVVCAVATLAAFVLTMSRTNMIALAVAYLVTKTLWARSWRERIVALALIAGGVAVLYWVSQRLLGHDYMRRILLLISDPSSVLRDTSLMERYMGHWPGAFANWLHDPASFVFGRGIGYVEVVDGTIPRLLSNQGLLGLAFFLLAWIVTPLVVFRRSRSIGRILILVLVNSITVETLVTSARAIQIYIPVFFSIAMMTGADDASSSRARRPSWLVRFPVRRAEVA
jgi:hypothetical protein